MCVRPMYVVFIIVVLMGRDNGALWREVFVAESDTQREDTTGTGLFAGETCVVTTT